MNAFANYSMQEVIEIIKNNNDEMRRGVSLRRDIDDLVGGSDWTSFSKFWK
jgi:hypothetical protein